MDGTIRRPGGKDSYNRYREVTLDCTRCGGKQADPISLVSRPDDAFKRSEYLRQVPMTDEHVKPAFGFRPDAESGDKDIEEAWHLKRMPAWAWHNQSLRMLLHARQVNAEACAIHCERLYDHGRLDDFDGPEPAAPHSTTARSTLNRTPRYPAPPGQRCTSAAHAEERPSIAEP